MENPQEARIVLGSDHSFFTMGTDRVRRLEYGVDYLSGKPPSVYYIHEAFEVCL